MEIVVPFERTIGERSGNDVYEMRVRVEATIARNWLISSARSTNNA